MMLPRSNLFAGVFLERRCGLECVFGECSFTSTAAVSHSFGWATASSPKKRCSPIQPDQSRRITLGTSHDSVGVCGSMLDKGSLAGLTGSLNARPQSR